MAEPVDGRHRGFGATGLRVGEIGAQRYRLADLPLPLLVLRESALAHNLQVMHGWCAARGLSLAPHGKTTMAPQLIRRQLDAGAWGMTAATVQQLAVMRAAGARRVILANQVVGTPEIAALDRERDGIEVLTLVDSVEGVAALDAGVRSPLRVLIELGGTRAGCRTDEDARAVAAAVAASRHLELAGIEGFEGTLGADRSPATLAAVDAFLERMKSLAETLPGEIIVTAGGSALFDRVAERLRFDDRVRVILRSGCYLTHDDGIYAGVSPLPLRPALELWARVLSCPEPGLAIAGFGKRDAPYDLGLPVVRNVPGVTVEALNDQHAFLRDSGKALRVSDVVVCGISHPCTAFDKWSLIPVVDDDDVVIDAVRTLF
jgi:D-serine deaminase-like pyridoxal phosphate-dependent protein